MKFKQDCDKASENVANTNIFQTDEFKERLMIHRNQVCDKYNDQKERVKDIQAQIVDFANVKKEEKPVEKIGL